MLSAYLDSNVKGGVISQATQEGFGRYLEYVWNVPKAMVVRFNATIELLAAGIKLKMMLKHKMNKKNYTKLITKKNALKVGLILLLLIITFTNTFRKFDGDSGLEIIFLIAQLYYSIYGGFYAYLFDKAMSGIFSSIDFIPNNSENKLIRRWWLLVHAVIFTLIQFR